MGRKRKRDAKRKKSRTIGRSCEGGERRKGKDRESEGVVVVDSRWHTPVEPSLQGLQDGRARLLGFARRFAYRFSWRNSVVWRRAGTRFALISLQEVSTTLAWWLQLKCGCFTARWCRFGSRGSKLPPVTLPVRIEEEMPAKRGGTAVVYGER